MPCLLQYVQGTLVAHNKISINGLGYKPFTLETTRILSIYLAVILVNMAETVLKTVTLPLPSILLHNCF
jgi:hypothetical protein